MTDSDIGPFDAFLSTLPNPDDPRAHCGECGRFPPTVTLRVALVQKRVPVITTSNRMVVDNQVEMWILCDDCAVLKGAVYPVRGKT